MTARRDEILDIATHVFATQGFAGATIRDIARAANLNSGSLYHHFASKEKLVEEIVEGYWVAMFDRIEPIAEDPNPSLHTVARMIRATLHVNETMSLAARIQMNDWYYLVKAIPSIPKHVRRLEEEWTSVLGRGIETGALRTDLDARMIFRSIMASINGLVFTHRPSASSQASAMTEAQVALWTRALAPEPEAGGPRAAN